MYNALVRNAKAKPIERTFGTLKNHISRIIDTFCGGTILERPESLKYKLKKGLIPEDEQIRSIFETLIDGDFNVDLYGGKERRYKGMTRIEVWNESVKRTTLCFAAEADLNILLSRVSLPQKISRKGVYITFSNEKLWYSSDDAVLHIGEKVYVRYDPSDIAHARIYDFETDEYLFTWTLADDMILPYIGASPDDIGNAERKRRAAEKAVKNYSKNLTADLAAEEKLDFLAATLKRAERQKQEKYKVELPDTFIPVISDKLKESSPQLEGIQEIKIDLERMNENALKRRK